MIRSEFKKIMKEAIDTNAPYVIMHEIILGVDMYVIIENKDFEFQREKLLNYFKEKGEMKNLADQEIVSVKIINDKELLNKIYKKGDNNE